MQNPERPSKARPPLSAFPHSNSPQLEVSTITKGIRTSLVYAPPCFLSFSLFFFSHKNINICYITYFTICSL